MTFKKNLLVLFLCFLGCNAFGQDVSSGKYYRLQQSLSVTEQNFILIQPEKPVTSMALRYPAADVLDNAYIETGDGKRYKLEQDADMPESLTASSQLVVFAEPVSRFRLYTGSLKGELSLRMLYVEPIQIPAQAAPRYKQENCEEPPTIPQSIWRVGLPDPKNSPERTDAEHVIVHHSAGSNTDTNYTKIVRNIYLYHTEENGWDDIAYNFLVAPNGWIYEGRDGRGLMPDDEVKGAHFCGKNSNTMGICVLGDYNDTIPTDTALASLEHLIAWKLNKEALNPYDSALHPKNTSGAQYLPTIAGHRDGCSTECPGDNLYADLPLVRDRVAAMMKGCTPPVTAFKAPEAPESLQIIPMYAAGQLSVSSPVLSLAGKYYQVIDMAGRVVSRGTFTESGRNVLDLHALTHGIYCLRIAAELPVSEKFGW